MGSSFFLFPFIAMQFETASQLRWRTTAPTMREPAVEMELHGKMEQETFSIRFHFKCKRRKKNSDFESECAAEG